MKNNEINGVQYLNCERFPDQRGMFIKLFSLDWVNHPNLEIEEIFYSNSKPGVIRGMHLQTGLAAGPRIVHIQSGSILDVLLDLRKESPTYLVLRSQLMTPNGVNSVFVPAGVAHGFQAIEESQTLYLSSKVYNQALDVGVDALSLQIKWPLEEIVRSSRDELLPSISDWIQRGIHDRD